MYSTGEDLEQLDGGRGGGTLFTRGMDNRKMRGKRLCMQWDVHEEAAGGVLHPRLGVHLAEGLAEEPDAVAAQVRGRGGGDGEGEGESVRVCSAP